jgi:aspartate racemase
MRTRLSPQDIEAEVTERWHRILGYEGTSSADDFFELGGTSLEAMQLLTGIEEDFGLAVSLAAFAERPTLEGLLEELQTARGEPTSSLVTLQPNGKRAPFFFMHAGLGHALFAQDLAKSMSEDQPLYGLQSRGLDGREEPLATIEAMAAHYINAVKTVQPHGPYRVGGFCMGAMLALEVACQLQDAGEEVSHLVVFSTDAFWKRASGIRDQLELHRREIAGRGTGGAVRYFRSRVLFRLYRLYSYGVILLHRLYAARGRSLPPRLRYVYVAQLNYRSSWRYQPRRFHGTISYFQGDADRLRDPIPFWAKQSTDGVEMHSVAGELEHMFSPPHVEHLAAALSQCLNKSVASDPPGQAVRR